MRKKHKLHWEFINAHANEFSEELLASFGYAEDYCKAGGIGVLEAGHLLYGLCINRNSNTAYLFQEYDVIPGAVSAKLEQFGAMRRRDNSGGRLEYSFGAQRIIMACRDTVVNRMNGKSEGSVGSMHLLFFLLTTDNTAIRILAELGVDIKEFAADVAEVLNGKEMMGHRTLFKMMGTETEQGSIFGEPEPAGEPRAPQSGDAAGQGAGQNGAQGQQFQGPGGQGQGRSALAQFGRDMTAQAAAGRYLPVIGRRKETERIVRILLRRNKNNPCLVGEAGVGKTAIIEGLANAIASGSAPACMRGVRIIALDMAAVVAGSRYRGDFEERIQQIIDETSRDPNVVLFIDEIHTIVGSGSTEGGMDASNLLKPALSRGEIRVIGATTQQEYRKYFEKDAALSRRFQPVTVNEPTEAETLDILKGLAPVFSAYHGVKYTESALETAVRLSKRYINDRFLPDKAIDLIDEAAGAKRLMREYGGTSGTPFPSREESRAKLLDFYSRKLDAIRAGDRKKAGELNAGEREAVKDYMEAWQREAGRETQTGGRVPEEITPQDIEQVVAQWSGVPVEKLGRSDSARLLELETELHCRLVGQDEAVSVVSKAVRRGRTGMKDPKRPIGSFLFLGPTGVGKTELAKALAENMFGSENSLIRLDMSEYMEAHSVSKMVGSPPGYIGHDDGGQLTERVRMMPYSVILFDELEKAHQDVYNILLQVLDDGCLTDSKGRVVDFKNTVIIMTSNIGARDITDKRRLGFADDTAEAEYSQMAERVKGELKKAFRPEFLNRIDETVIFKPLTMEEIGKIAELQLKYVAERAKESGITVIFAPGVADYLAKKGYDPKFGARPLKRVIQREVEDRLSGDILRLSAEAGDNAPVSSAVITVKVAGGGLETEISGRSRTEEAANG